MSEPVELVEREWSPQEMAASIMDYLDLIWPLHRHHHRRVENCAWCVITFPTPRPEPEPVVIGLA